MIIINFIELSRLYLYRRYSIIPWLWQFHEAGTQILTRTRPSGLSCKWHSMPGTTPCFRSTAESSLRQWFMHEIVRQVDRMRVRMLVFKDRAEIHVVHMCPFANSKMYMIIRWSITRNNCFTCTHKSIEFQF